MDVVRRNRANTQSICRCLQRSRDGDIFFIDALQFEDKSVTTEEADEFVREGFGVPQVSLANVRINRSVPTTGRAMRPSVCGARSFKESPCTSAA